MTCEPLPEHLRLLADPSQEVLVAHRSTFSQLAPVPLRQLGVDSVVAGESYLPASESQRN
ncbi:MAG TPA: hypothetical protein VGB75_16935 [Jatrophihabitans sp.]|jgi:hypothetical protein|uniref:hypothetical protein n=1 Tax=Jatrophihabitans sp. TaxID=1932789 RepID=UPI002EE43B5C